MLRLEAKDAAGEQQLLVNLLVHVSKDKADESRLVKTVLNPIE
jgi:hypothetical protein